MANEHYYQVMQIINELNDELVSENKFNRDVLDTMYSNLAYIFDIVTNKDDCNTIRLSIASYCSTAASRGIVNRQVAAFYRDNFNRMYTNYATKITAANQFATMFYNLKSQGTICSGNAIQSYAIQNIAAMLELPGLVNRYIQSKDLLQDIYDMLIDLHTELLQTLDKNTLFSMNSIIDLANTAGYITRDQATEIKQNYVKIDDYDTYLADALGLVLQNSEDESTDYFGG